jgi:hypothetical protein
VPYRLAGEATPLEAAVHRGDAICRYNWVVRRILVGLAVSVLLAGCTPAAEPQARAAAEAFQAAVDSRNVPAACALLSDPTRENLESAAATSCVQALGRLDLAGGRVGEVSVWGGNAQAKIGAGALFLAEYSSGWKVTAMGCTFRSKDLPYDCAVEG